MRELHERTMPIRGSTKNHVDLVVASPNSLLGSPNSITNYAPQPAEYSSTNGSLNEISNSNNGKASQEDNGIRNIPGIGQVDAVLMASGPLWHN
jgi:hypothetical protein